MPATTPNDFKLPPPSQLMYAGSPRRILQKLEVDLSTRNTCAMRKAS